MLGFWAVMGVAGGIMAPFFITNTTMNFDAPVSSLAGIADDVLAGHFPKLNKAAAGVIVVRSGHGGSVLGPDGQGAALNAFSLALNKTIWSFQPGKGSQIVVEVDGYTSMAAQLGAAGASEAKQLFISPHEDAAMILIQANAADSIRYLDFVKWINDGLPAALAKSHAVVCPPDDAAAEEPPLPLGGAEDGSWAGPCNPMLTAEQTGLGMFTQEALDGVEHDLEKMDSVSSPKEPLSSG